MVPAEGPARRCGGRGRGPVVGVAVGGSNLSYMGSKGYFVEIPGTPPGIVLISRTPKHTIMKMTFLFGSLLMAGALLSSQGSFAQRSPDLLAGTPKEPNLKAVKAWYTAFEQKDWNSIQQVLADGFTFSSPLDDHIDLAKFKERCWPNAYNIKRFEVDKLVIDGDNIFVVTNGYTNSGKLFRNCDSFKLKDGKISAYECFFGPGINYPNSGK